MSGFQYDRSSLDVGPGDAREEFYGLTGIRLSNFFGGSSLTDAFGGAVLAPVGAPSFDALVADTLNGAPLITDPPSYLWNHAFRFQATGDSYTVPAVDSVPLGEESVMVAVTARFLPPGVSADLCGNRAMTPATGLEVKYDGQNFRVTVTAQPAGQAASTVNLLGALDNNLWHTIVVIADRANNLLRCGTIDGEASVALAATGTLQSTRPFSIGKGRGLALLADTMHVLIAVGPQVEGRSPTNIAQAIAGAVYWDRDFSRVTAPAR